MYLLERLNGQAVSLITASKHEYNGTLTYDKGYWVVCSQNIPNGRYIFRAYSVDTIYSDIAVIFLK